MMVPEEGDLRLVAQREVNGYTFGALQIFLDGAFGAVCGRFFFAADADVACRQLGFVGGGRTPDPTEFLTDSEIQEAIAPFALHVPECSGSEERLLDCAIASYGDSPPQFLPCEDDFYSENPAQSNAYVACGSASGPEDGQLRLAGGATSEDGLSRFGRLEYSNAGGWGLVCGRGASDSKFSAADAQVACRSLGFSEGVPIVPGDVDEGIVSFLPVWLSSTGCVGNESSVLECPDVEDGLSTRGCFMGENIELICSSGPNPELDGRLRLVDGGSGPGYEYGRLEIFLRGFWSTVCDDRGFTPDAALVACRGLGYDGGAVLRFTRPHGTFPENEVLVKDIPVGLSAVDCNGTEASLLECSSADAVVGDCSVRGVDLEPANDATVLACGEASESAAAGCDKEPVAEQGAVRLRGGFGSPCDPLHSGIVEVFNAGEWGAICDGDTSPFNDYLVADVVCRQLGFPHGTVVDSLVPDQGFTFDYSSAGRVEEAEAPQGRFWLERVQCRGPEERLVDCFLGEGFAPASGRSDVCRSAEFGGAFALRVACRQFPVPEALEDFATPGAEEGDLRLVDLMSIANWDVGRLELFFEGSWGLVCGLQFGAADAAVACRQLGYSAGSPKALPLDFREGDALVIPETALTLPGCTGNETSLLSCPGEDPEPTGSGSLFVRARCAPGVPFDGNRRPGMQLACVASVEQGQEGDVRLSQRSVVEDVTRGFLEVFHAGAWGTVCSGGSFTAEFAPGAGRAAAVACRQLGLTARGAQFESVQARSIPEAGPALPPAWLNQTPDCLGTEPRLTDCGPLAYGEIEDCTAFVRLICPAST